MKYITTIFLSVITLSFSAAAAADGYVGTFKGEENIVLSGCTKSSLNGASVGVWEVTHKASGESAYKGKGKTPSGNFKCKGKIDSNSASGSSSGTNQWGAAWNAKFTSELDGDNISLSSSGRIPSWGCKFTSEVKATRQ